MAVMRTTPVDLSTLVALPEQLKIAFGFRFQVIDDCFFFHRLQDAVAAQAPFPRVDCFCQIKAQDNRLQLLIRVYRTQAVAVNNPAALQQTAIARQKHSLRFIGKIGQLFVIELVSEVKRIKSKEAQMAREPSEVVVQQESDRIGQRRTESENVFQGKAGEWGIDTDVLVKLHDVTESHWPPVDQNQANFRMGNSQRLYQMFDRLVAIVNGVSEGYLALVRREEVVEIGVKTEGR